MMTSWAFTIELRDDAAIHAYREYHRNVWPEIAGPGGALETVGVRRMQIFHMPPRTLFMLVEAVDGFDPVTDFGRALDLHPRVKEWDDIMHGQLLTRVQGNRGPLNWALMEQVYDYAAPTA